MPQMMQQVANRPELFRAISNPRVREALMQVERGMMTLEQEAPGLFTGYILYLYIYFSDIFKLMFI